VEDEDWELFEEAASEQEEEGAQGETQERLRLAHRGSGRMDELIPVLQETDVS
jgi:hypothetical protein